MTSNDQNAARAANYGARLTKPQAAELLRQGRLLQTTRYADRKALWQRLGLTEDLAQSLMVLVDAEASAGKIATVGLDAAIRAARAGLTLWPKSEITYICRNLDGAELIEFFVPSQAEHRLVAYYGHTQHNGVVARCTHTLRRPIDLGLTSIAAALAPKVERQEIWDGDCPSPQQILRQVECMQARGLRVEGKRWAGGSP